MRRRTRLVGVLAAVTASALTVTLATGPAAADPREAHPPVTATTATTATGTGAWVTLITGDRVLVYTAGGHTELTVDPAPRPTLTQFIQFTRDGDQYVLPTDAATLVRDGTVDEQLFNVTGLLRQGFDDAHTDTVPLLVRYADARRAAHPSAPAGASVRRALPGVHMAALEENKSAATRFWARSLTTAAPAGTGSQTLTGGRQLTGGILNVWLDGTVHASLDQSVPQIGAPAAWAKDLTGTGVTVAVLDTGVDTHHPDLADAIGATRDFTGSGTVEDPVGHGTHVASIIAGSGAASDGVYRGVAPDATLEIGKVLDATGHGSFDTILAGMQWAASSGAQVVNMSLGGDATDGNDPLSMAVNTLTAEYGTLFVISAGNVGADESVSSPAAADAALAVASVDRSDHPSDFSSRGPRFRDGAAKPDLAAPGAGIVAARASGVPPTGEPVGDHYQRLNGTSMAAPHVAGSAALLAQQHTDWAGPRLKAALMSTAVELPGVGPFTTGTGRVDVARATSQPVTATGSSSTYFAWPNQGASATRTVTWHNDGDTPVTLSVSATLTDGDGQPAPAGLLALSGDTVTVPAGGDASVRVTLTAVDGHPGNYRGILTGRNAEATVTTRTALSVYQEEEKYDLTVHLVNRHGAVPPPVNYASVIVVNTDDGGVYFPTAGQPFRLPRGRYVVHGVIEDEHTGYDPTYSFISRPGLTLDHDTTLTLDARDGRPASVRPDNPAARGGVHRIELLSRVAQCECTYAVFSAVDPRFSDIYAGTVPGTSSPDFGFAQIRRANEPLLELFAHGEQTFEVRADWFDQQPAHDEQATVPAVYGGAGTAEDVAHIDAAGKLVVVEIPAGLGLSDLVARTQAIKDAGARMVLAVPPGQPTSSAALGGKSEPPRPALPMMIGIGQTAQRFLALVRAGETSVSYVNRTSPQHRYELAYTVAGAITQAPVHRPRTADLAAVETSYHDNATDFPSGRAHGVVAFQEFMGRMVGVGLFLPVGPARERTEYFTPGTWQLMEESGPADLATDTVSLRAGSRDHVSWNKAVAGPSLLGMLGSAPKQRPWAGRLGGAIDVMLPMFGDAAGRPLLPVSTADSGSISLYRDGTLVGTTPSPDM
ncbi:MAG TPA: S8 family serine peptidase, partial [Mycobacteriales bacterium]